MELNHDRKSYRSHCVRQSRTKVQGQNHKSPHRTSLEKALVAHSSFLYQSKICERSKTSEKKLAGMSERIGQVFGEQKQTQRRCANRIRQYFNVLFVACSGRMDIVRSVKT
jgi:hypothetical protein